MKNNILKFGLFALMFSAIVSCGDEDVVIYDVNNGQALLSFNGVTNVDLPVTVDGVSTVDIEVGVTTVSSSDRAISVSVDAASTAAANEYSLSSLVIPAGAYTGSMTITGNFDTVPDGVTNTIVINLDETAGVLIGGKSSATINIFRFCPSDLAGTYVVLSSGESTDGAPVNNPIVDFEYTVEVTKNEDGTYAISDGVAGIYQDWYCSPYGYCFETAGSFKDICGQLSGSWVEAFGSTVTLTGQDNGDGTLTITWVNGFGDTATGVYTLQ